MDIVQGKRKKKDVLQVPSDRISLYLVPPVHEVTLEDFEQAAVERLNVLKEIDEAHAKGLKPQELQHRLREVARRIPLKTREEERRDALGHFALRLAYGAREHEQAWLVRQETLLLRFRMENQLQLGVLDTAALLRGSGVEYPALSEEALAAHHAQLAQLLPAGTPAAAARALQGSDYYVVPFERALDLVARRRCLVVAGAALVYKSDLVGIVLSHFQSLLKEALARVPTAAKEGAAKGRLHADERVAGVLGLLSHASLTSAADHKWDEAGGLDMARLDEVAGRSFPACMRALLQGLRQQHKLKHMGRMQLGLFLKGAGVTLEESLAFWREEFTKVMPEKTFEQQYAYNIRHNYGKEGRRADYTPYACVKIIASGSSSQGADLHHGCPFKNWEAERVQALLARSGAPPAAVAEVVQSVRDHHYQIACRRFFELTHPGADRQVATKHPNQYLRESLDYHAAAAAAAKEAEAEAGPAQ